MIKDLLVTKAREALEKMKGRETFPAAIPGKAFMFAPESKKPETVTARYRFIHAQTAYVIWHEPRTI